MKDTKRVHIIDTIDVNLNCVKGEVWYHTHNCKICNVYKVTLTDMSYNICKLYFQEFFLELLKLFAVSTFGGVLLEKHNHINSLSYNNTFLSDDLAVSG